MGTREDECAVENALRELRSEDEGARLGAVRRLKESPVAQAMQALFEVALHDPVPYLRSEAVDALMPFASPESVEPLIRVLRTDPIRYVRMRCLEALGSLADERAAAELIRFLADPDAELVWKAAEALGRAKRREALGYLVGLFSHPDMYVREKAAEALGNLGTPEAREPLRQVVEDEDLAYSLDDLRFVRAARAALERLDAEHPQDLE